MMRIELYIMNKTVSFLLFHVKVIMTVDFDFLVAFCVPVAHTLFCITNDNRMAIEYGINNKKMKE